MFSVSRSCMFYIRKRTVFRGLSVCHSTSRALIQNNNNAIKHNLNIKKISAICFGCSYYPSSNFIVIYEFYIEHV